LGKQPVGDKLKIGDNRTPEGVFFIDFKKPESRFYKSLHISYPDAAHAQFVVLLSRPSKSAFHALHCNSPASSADIVRRDDGYLLTSGPTSRR
jgi:hypothetical protein